MIRLRAFGAFVTVIVESPKVNWLSARNVGRRAHSGNYRGLLKGLTGTNWRQQCFAIARSMCSRGGSGNRLSRNHRHLEARKLLPVDVPSTVVAGDAKPLFSNAFGLSSGKQCRGQMRFKVLLRAARSRSSGSLCIRGLRNATCPSGRTKTAPDSSIPYRWVNKSGSGTKSLFGPS